MRLWLGTLVGLSLIVFAVFGYLIRREGEALPVSLRLACVGAGAGILMAVGHELGRRP